MLKLNASFSKKVPAEQDYSSKGYSANIEIELPDGLTQEQLQGRIHDTFEMVRTSVESEINGANPVQANIAYPVDNNPLPAPNNQNHIPTQRNTNGNRSGNGKASPRQIKYLTDLAREGNINLSGYLHNYGLSQVDALSRQQCSQLIDQIRGQKAA